MEEILRGEGTEEAGFEQQYQCEVEIGLAVHVVRRVNRHERDDGGEHEHQRTEAVHAEAIFDAKRRRPGVLLDKAHAAVGGQMRPDYKRNCEACHGGENGDETRADLPAKRAIAAPATGSRVSSVKRGKSFIQIPFMGGCSR